MKNTKHTRNLLTVTSIICLSLGGVKADEASSKDSLSNEVLVLTGVDKNTEEAVYLSVVARTNANYSPDEERALITYLNEKKIFQWRDAAKSFATILSDSFTEQELKDLVAFFSSKTGQKWIATQQEVGKKTNATLHKLVENKKDEILEAVNAYSDAK